MARDLARCRATIGSEVTTLAITEIERERQTVFDNGTTSPRGHKARTRFVISMTLAWMLLAVAWPATADVIARVAEVIDGRTIKVELTVRLRDIEIPKPDGTCAYEQALATSVKREVQRVIGGRVALSRVAADDYGRLVARVVSRDAGNLGAYLVAEGLAKETGRNPATWCE